MLSLLDGFLRARSRLFLTGASLALVAATGAADYFTGYFLSLGIFYVAPVSLSAWYVSRLSGVASALLSAAVWYFVNAAFAPPEVNQAVLLWNSAVRLAYFTIISNLVSSLKAAYRRQEELARIDPLTGLLNSRTFRDEAARELARARRLGYPVGILYLDLDNFKALNDTGGHAAGDRLLRRLGPAILGAVRSTDLVGRVGGDEFALLLGGTGRSHLETAASKVRQAVLRTTAELDPVVSVTIGALAGDGSEGIDTLLHQADELMYKGKASQKGSIQILGEAGGA